MTLRYQGITRNVLVLLPLVGAMMTELRRLSGSEAHVAAPRRGDDDSVVSLTAAAGPSSRCCPS